MTFEEFLTKCREKDGWVLREGRLRPRIRNGVAACPLMAVFGREYVGLAKKAGLNVWAIADAADGYTNGPYRKALLTLVKS